MSTFYDQMATTASRLISQFGNDVVLARSIGHSVDPVTGVVTSGSSESLLTKGIMRSYPQNLIDGTRIKATDKMLIIDASVEPLLSDFVKFDNTDWVITEIVTNNPAGIPLTYTLKVNQ